MRFLPLLLLLGACAATDVPASGEADLARELAGRVAGEPRSCVPVAGGQSLQIADPRTLTYRQGATLWVNRLSSECPGFRLFNTLVVEVQGSQYCRNDQVRALDPGSSIPGPTCLLEDFVPYRRTESAR